MTGERVLPGKVFLENLNVSNLSDVNAGTLDSAGHLHLSITQPPAADTFFTLVPDSTTGCTFAGSGDPSTRVSFWTNTLVVSQQGDPLGRVTQVRTDQTFPEPHVIARMYSNVASTFNGTITCPSSKAVISLHLQQGWNAVEYVTSASNVTLSDVPAGVTTELRGTALTPDVVAFMEASTLNFTTDTVSTPVSFYQAGGFSGTIHLSTDNDLLTVEPSTVTLPALSTQSTRTPVMQPLGLSRQQLSTTLTFKLAGNTSGTTNLIVKDDQGRELDRLTFYVTSSLPGFSMSTYVYPNTVLPGGTLPLTVTVFPMNGFKGAVDITAQNPPTGLTVTGTTVSVAQGYDYGQITVNAASTVAPGSYTLTLLGTSGSTRATTQLTVIVPAPALSLTANSVTVYGGEQTTLPVTVTGQNNFAGSVTLSVSGLPSGVTATSKTVTLTKNGSVGTTLTLTGDTNLISAAAPVTLNATGTNASAKQDLSLSTRIKRVLLGQYSLAGVGTASEGGFWYARRPYNGYSLPVLARFDGTKDVMSVEVNDDRGYTTYNILTIPTGGAWLPAVYGGSLFRYVGSTLKSFPLNITLDQVPTVDSKGRLWAVVSDYSTSTTAFSRFDDATGSFVSVAPLVYSSYGSRPMGNSHDARYVATYDSTKLEVVTVDTTTQAVTRTSVTGLNSISRVAVDALGTAWLFGTLPTYEAALGQVGADGTTTITKLNGTYGFSPQVFAFDSTGNLWLAGSGYAGVFTPAGSSLRSIVVPSDNSPYYALNQSGGLWQVWTDNAGSTYASLYK